MNRIKVAGVLGVLALGIGVALAQAPANMSFFVTSKNPGKGGDLGGLAGADAYCQSLAAKVGAGNKTWHAYLSTSTVNAKDRIGKGPWYNVKGVMIAKDLSDLIGAKANHINAETALTEEGKAPNYLGGNPPAPLQEPLQHDMLTGTDDNGMATDMTCNNWTSSSDEGGAKARLGHHDYAAWNSAHDSRGCSQQALVSTGGAGLFYCFALPAR